MKKSKFEVEPFIKGKKKMQLLLRYLIDDFEVGFTNRRNFSSNKEKRILSSYLTFRFRGTRVSHGCIEREAWLRVARDNNNSSLRGTQHAAPMPAILILWPICTQRRKIKGARAARPYSPFWIGQTRFVEEDSQR